MTRWDWLIVVLVGVFLVGCGGEQVPPPIATVGDGAPVPTTEQLVASEAELATKAAAQNPTAAAQNPTAATSPAAPASTITPQQLLDAFRAAGLEVGETRAMTAEEYGAAPLAEEGIRFLIPSLGADGGGSVLRYATEEGAAQAKAYYDGLGAGVSWTFQQGTIVVQIRGPEVQARQFEAVLNGLQ